MANPQGNCTYTITTTSGGPYTIVADTFELSTDGTVLIFSTRSANQNPADPELFASQFLFLKSNVTMVTYVGDAAGFSLGGVNNQTGTSYTIAASDNGKIVTLNNASAVAVTLPSTGIAAGYFGSVEDLGAGTATLTPSTGTINGHASITLVSNQSAFLYFDGTNWWAATSVAAGSGYSLGGTLSNSNATLGAGAGTGASITGVVGLDGTHYVEVLTGSSPTGTANIFTLSFTTTRGHITYPVFALTGNFYTTLAQLPQVIGGSATQYSLQSGTTPLSAATSYVFYVSCP